MNMNHAHIEKWNSGRLWMWDVFHVEWHIFTSHLMFHIDFFGGDSDRDLSVTIGTKLFYLHVALQGILPKRWQPEVDYKISHSTGRTFGISYHDACLWLSPWVDEMGWSREQPWYMQNIVFHMPWGFDWIRTSTKLRDNSWHHEFADKRKTDPRTWLSKHNKLQEVRWTEEYPYTYKLLNGDEQKVTAAVGVSEREWRPKWFKWTKLFAKIRRTIDIEFSDEVGNERGSWKGGTLGCGYNMKADETPLECLRRMELERVFR